jgi:hypothetical protein
MAYKDAFTREQFPNGLVEAVQELETKIWHNPENIKKEGVEAFLTKASAICGINKPNFAFKHNPLMYNMTGGCYVYDTNTIFLFTKFSLVTLLHEFRHAMQYQTGCCPQDESEEDSRGWSCSLYFIADPERYDRAVTKGILHFA